jgi:hypothetical protein
VSFDLPKVDKKNRNTVKILDDFSIIGTSEQKMPVNPLPEPNGNHHWGVAETGPK